MSEYEEQCQEFLSNGYLDKKGCKNWHVYEQIKNRMIFDFDPTDEQYLVMIKIITDWLEL